MTPEPRFEELLVAGAFEVEELPVLEVGSVLLEVGSMVLELLLGVMAAEVSTSIWGATVEVGVGVLLLVLDLQAAGTGSSSHSSSSLARPAQASLTLISWVEPLLPGSMTTKSYTVGPGTATVSVVVSTARLWK